MSSRDRRLLIAGCGYVGVRLSELASAAGWRVAAARRRPERLREVWAGGRPPGVSPVALDLEDEHSVASALREPVDAVVLSVGPDGPSEEAYRRAYVRGLEVLLRGFERAAQWPRVVFVSSTAVYGQQLGEWLDEDSATAPTRWNGRILLEAESRLRAAPVVGSVLRLGGIYGPGRTRLVERVRSGAARIQPGPPHFGNRIHREDAASAVLHVLEQVDPSPIYLGVDREPADEAEVLRFLARELGASEPITAGPDDPAPPRRAGSKRCQPRRLVEEGFVHRYPSYREGYRALLRSRGEARADEAGGGGVGGAAGLSSRASG